jgi:DNA repair photolyase
VTVREVRARSLLRRQKHIDSWFLSGCGMNLYRGCLHDCAYCDGRSESYAVAGGFGEEVEVKINAVELLRRELAPLPRRRGLPPPGFVLLGGGVGDSYQPPEERYRLARGALELLLEMGRPVHVLTKSTLVERDLGLLARIHERSRAIVSMSLSSTDERLSSLFEPGVPPASARLAVLSSFRRVGIPTGVFLMPVLPFLSDGEEALERALEQAAEAGVRFLVFGGLTLKPGRQQEHFLAALRAFRPELEEGYRKLYPGDRWGRAAGAYYGALERRFGVLARKHRLPPRIPPALYEGLLPPAERAVVVLEHLHYLLQLRGEQSAYRAAARTLASDPALAAAEQLDLFPAEGLSAEAAAVLGELRRTGRCRLLEDLLAG